MPTSRICSTSTACKSCRPTTSSIPPPLRWCRRITGLPHRPDPIRLEAIRSGTPDHMAIVDEAPDPKTVVRAGTGGRVDLPGEHPNVLLQRSRERRSNLCLRDLGEI